MIEIIKIEPISRITSTLVCPRLLTFKVFSLFMFFPSRNFSNLINAAYIVSN